MKILKALAKIIFKIILFFCILGTISVFAFFLYFFFDFEGSCASEGNVWDHTENRCREDCLTWNKVNGCIYMNEEYQHLFEACGNRQPDCDEKRKRELFLELCKKYNAPVNIEHGYCDFEFEPKDCFKLKGDWKYPDICKNFKRRS